MRAWIFLPFADLPSLGPDGARLRRPQWPYGDTGSRGRGTSEFLRGFGPLSATPGREADSWLGRRQHVRARHPRFEAQDKLRVTCRRRRIYGDRLTPRLFYELELECNRVADESGIAPAEMARDILNLPMRFPDGMVGKVHAMSSQLAASISRALMPSNQTIAEDVVSCQPLLVLEQPSGGGNSTYHLTVHRIAHVSSADVVFVSGRGTRDFATALSRIHIDAHVLMAIAVAALRRPKLALAWPWESLVQYYVHARKFRKKPTAYGIQDFPDLIADYERDGSTDWALVEAVFEPRRQQLRLSGGMQVNDNSIRIWNRDGTVITGTVLNSFNRIDERDPALASALAEIVDFATRSGSPEGKEIAEELVKKADEDKPGLCRALWDGLVKVLPEVVTLGGAVSVIAAWLGV